MKPSPETQGPRCPDSAALERHVFNEVSGNQPDTAALDRHLAVCDDCRTRLETLSRRAREWMQWMASPSITAAGEGHPSLERLGRYLDCSLSPDERVSAESHLAHCAQCRSILVGLYRDTVAILEEEARGAPLLAFDRPPGSLSARRLQKALAPNEEPFSMEEWLKTGDAIKASRATTHKQRKPRQSTR